MTPSAKTMAEIAPCLPVTWGKPRVGVAPFFPKSATRRMGVNWNGDECIDRLSTEIGRRDVLGCAVFEGLEPGTAKHIIRVDVWVRA